MRPPQRSRWLKSGRAADSGRGGTPVGGTSLGDESVESVHREPPPARSWSRSASGCRRESRVRQRKCLVKGANRHGCGRGGCAPVLSCSISARRDAIYCTAHLASSWAVRRADGGRRSMIAQKQWFIARLPRRHQGCCSLLFSAVCLPGRSVYASKRSDAGQVVKKLHLAPSPPRLAGLLERVGCYSGRRLISMRAKHRSVNPVGCAMRRRLSSAAPPAVAPSCFEPSGRVLLGHRQRFAAALAPSAERQLRPVPAHRPGGDGVLQIFHRTTEAFSAHPTPLHAKTTAICPPDLRPCAAVSEVLAKVNQLAEDEISSSRRLLLRADSVFARCSLRRAFRVPKCRIHAVSQ